MLYDEVIPNLATRPPMKTVQRLFLIVLLMAASVALPGNVGARPAMSGAHAAFNELQARADGALLVSWDETTQVPNFIAGVNAATRLPYRPSAAEIGHPVAIARGFLDENRALFRLSSAADELQLIRVEADTQLNFSHVRLAQVYHHIPVFGRQLIVHLDPQNQIAAVNGHYLPDLDVPTEPSITPQQAEDVALQDVMQTQLTADERARVKTNVLHDKTQLMIYVDQDGRARLTWRVTILTDAPLGQWYSFVNARRLAVVHRFDSADHDKRRQTYTANNSTDLPGRLLIDEGERSRDAVAQAAHDGAGKVYDYYARTFRRDGIDGQGMTIVSTVHYGSDPEDAENAAWIGEAKQMIYGDGGKIFKPLPYGLDVVGHELTHGVIDSTADLVYEGQSGALNESYADVFGALIDRSNWTIGEAVIKSPPFPVPYLRSLEDPHADNNYDPNDPINSIGQPATVDEYANLPLTRKEDNGGVHVNSGIPNHAAYLVGQALGPEKLEQIYYRALTQYLSPDSNFFDAARATVRAAQELYSDAEANAVQQAFAQVGIDLQGSDNTPAPPSSSTTPTGQTRPEQSQTLPPGCTNLIVNGGFEQNSGWIEVTKGNTSLLDPELPYTGKRSAWLGGTDKEPLQYIYQDARIGANATTVTLSYYRLIHEELAEEADAFTDDATFSVVIANTKGDVLDTAEAVASAGGDDEWSQMQFDMSPYAGKTVRLVFAAENPRGNISSMFVDDVSLVACTTGSGPSAPRTRSQDLVYIQGTVKSSDTSRGIEGAQVFIMKPGLSATDAAADDSVTRDEVIAFGTTDARGFYQTDKPITRGQTYSAIVIAQGYRPIVADDGMEIPSNATNPYQIDATMRKSR
jgi:Zn-dependent metalloprotease